jgi:hypothetical protein
MFRIPIINQNERFLDIDEEPLVHGRVDVLDPVSNNPITVWSYSDDEYVEMTNPVRLDVEGRTPHTVFCDRIAYIRVYKYLGLDEWNQPMFEFVRDYYAGENKDSESKEYIVGMTALKELDPSVNSSINVLGYYGLGDCGMRTYVWDPNSTLDADNGYVIASSVEANGRWILQFDGPYIPSTYYGVDEDHLSNVAALLTYAGQVSGKKTAPGIYFIPGHYQNNSWWTTTKKILVASNTQFDYGIQCSWVDVKGKPTTWIGDLMPTDSSCPVHSCWYKNARSFWGCASRIKYADGKNWTDNTITANLRQTRVHFIGADSALTTNTGSNWIIFDTCTFDGTGFLNSSTKCKYLSMEFKDTYYVNAAFDEAKVQLTVTGGQGCTMNPLHFKNPLNYVKAARLAGMTKIDMQGTTINDLADLTGFSEISNLNCDRLTIGGGDSGINNVTLKDVTVIDYVSFLGQILSVKHSSLRLKEFPYLVGLSVTDNSDIQGGWELNRGTVLSCSDSTWGMDVGTGVTTVGFTRSTISGTIKSRNMTVRDCTGPANLKVYPGTVSGHNEFKITAINNVLNSDIEFVNDGKYDIYFNVKIVGNTFNGEKGLVCTYWTDMVNARRTIAPYSDTIEHKIEYSGNHGNCPADRYVGNIRCSATPWFTWDGAWMRGVSNPSYTYAVYCGDDYGGYKSKRYFLIDGSYANGLPKNTRKSDWGAGMLLGLNETNEAYYAMINFTEMLTDSLDTGFIDWAAQHGVTPQNTNDYFLREAALVSSDYAAGRVYLFWN